MRDMREAEYRKVMRETLLRKEDEHIISLMMFVAEYQTEHELYDVSFTYEGTSVNNPFMDVTGRFAYTRDKAAAIYGDHNLQRYKEKSVDWYLDRCTLYNVTFMMCGRGHSNLVFSMQDTDSVARCFGEEVIGCKVATGDDYRPDKPLHLLCCREELLGKEAFHG